MGVTSAIRGPRLRGKAPLSAARILAYAAAGLLAIAIALAVILFTADLGIVRDLINRRVSAATGRTFRITGPLELRASWPPEVRASGIVMTNAEWSEDERMIDIPNARFAIRILPLLAGRVSIPVIALDEPRIVLEKSAEGEANWKFGSGESSERTVLPDIGLLSITGGTLIYRDPAKRTDVEARVSTEKADDGSEVLRVTASGTYAGVPLEGEGTGGSVLSIMNDSAPYPLDVRASIGGLTASLDGQVTSLSTFEEIEAEMELSGNTLSAFYPLAGVTLPPTRPFTIAGRLSRARNDWSVSAFEGTIGKSDVSGDFSISVREPRPKIVSIMTSKSLDLADLEGFVGTPETRAEAGDPEAKRLSAQEARHDKSGRVLSDADYSLERLNAVDADYRLKATSIKGIKNPIDNLDMHLVLENGVARLEPLNFGVAGGNIVSSVKLDAREKPIRSTMSIEIERLRIGELLAVSETIEKGAGLIGGRAELSGIGNSPAALLGSADGKLGIISTGGKVSELLIEFLQLHAGEIAMLLVVGDEPVDLRCSAAQFQIRDGMMTTDFFVVDTEESSITADGRIDLAKERLDLTIDADPKEAAVLSAQSPLRVTGSFRDPDVYPEPGSLLVRGGIAAALGFLNPLAALAALVDIGTGDDQPCAALVAEVRKTAKMGKGEVAQ